MSTLRDRTQIGLNGINSAGVIRGTQSVHGTRGDFFFSLYNTEIRYTSKRCTAPLFPHVK